MSKIQQTIIAEKILSQMGGLQKIRSMINGFGFSYGNEERGSYLQFGWKATSAKNYLNKIKIIYDESKGTYNVEFWDIGKTNLSCNLRKQVYDIYADSLIQLFEEETGLWKSKF